MIAQTIDYWLADGVQRRAGAVFAGRTKLNVEPHPGTRRDAVLYAYGANAVHGLRRSNIDKRRAVETLLRDDEWHVWSDHQVAEKTRIDHKTVAAVRRDTGDIPSVTARVVERKRKQVVVDVAAINAGRVDLAPRYVTQGWRLCQSGTPVSCWAEQPAQGRRTPSATSVNEVEQAIEALVLSQRPPLDPDDEEPFLMPTAADAVPSMLDSLTDEGRSLRHNAKQNHWVPKYHRWFQYAWIDCNAISAVLLVVHVAFVLVLAQAL